MARDGDRRGASVPRRSPEELAEMLATLAAATPEPPPRPRRRGTVADQWPERFAEQPDQTPVDTSAVAAPPLEVTPAPESPVEAEAPEEVARDPAPASDLPAPARSRLRSRTGGRVWQGRRPSRNRLGLRTAARRRSLPPRSASHRAKPRSRNPRRVYPSLIGLLLIVVVVGLLNRGGGGSSPNSTQSASAPTSVFPTPSPVPAPTPPPVPVPVPTQAAKRPAVAPQPKPCRPVQVHGRAVTVSILHGQVICRNARAVVRALELGNGRHAGSPAHPFVIVRGWRCLPSGTCTRPGKSIKAS